MERTSPFCEDDIIAKLRSPSQPIVVHLALTTAAFCFSLPEKKWCVESSLRILMPYLSGKASLLSYHPFRTGTAAAAMTMIIKPDLIVFLGLLPADSESDNRNSMLEQDLEDCNSLTTTTGSIDTNYTSHSSNCSQKGMLFNCKVYQVTSDALCHRNE